MCRYKGRKLTDRNDSVKILIESPTQLSLLSLVFLFPWLHKMFALFTEKWVERRVEISKYIVVGLISPYTYYSLKQSGQKYRRVEQEHGHTLEKT